MAFLERAMQNAQAGQPNLARSAAPGRALGTPMTSRPAATPASPAVMSGPQGRPPAPAPIGAPTTPMPYPKPPQVTAGGGSPTLGGGAGPFSPVQPVISKTTTTTTPVAPTPEPAPAPVPRVFKGMPSAFEMKSLQPGEQGMTPWGPATLGEDGKPRIQFTPEGEMAYRKAVVAERKKVRLPRGFEALAESLPVTPGQPNFDPFSGKWTT